MTLESRHSRQTGQVGSSICVTGGEGEGEGGREGEGEGEVEREREREREGEGDGEGEREREREGEGEGEGEGEEERDGTIDLGDKSLSANHCPLSLSPSPSFSSALSKTSFT